MISKCYLFLLSAGGLNHYKVECHKMITFFAFFKLKALLTLFPCLKQLAILIRPFAISSVEFWYNLLVWHNIITFLKYRKQCKSCTCHSKCYALSRLKNVFQMLL